MLELKTVKSIQMSKSFAGFAIFYVMLSVNACIGRCILPHCVIYRYMCEFKLSLMCVSHPLRHCMFLWFDITPMANMT